jgi:multiple sugar transport system substrate-binding protein
MHLKKLLAAAAIAALAAGCTPSAEKKDVAAPGVEPTGAIEFWHPFTDREAKAVDDLINDYRAKYPKVTVTVKGEQDDGKMIQAIGAGQGPDVAMSYSTDIVGRFCASGAWVDLNQYLNRDKVDLNRYPQVVRSYTEYRGKRCAMPFLADAYGLYFNKTIFSEAGVAAPPKTLAELSDLAKKLTIRDKDGKIERAGFLPLFGFYENSPSHMGPMVGASWLKSDGTSNIGGDPKWQELIKWQKELVDWFGYDKLEEFRASLGDEWSAENAFQQGKVAMNIDGEWRLAFLKDQAPDVKYGVTSLPVNDASRAGAGYTTGNVIGVSKTSSNPEAAWSLIRFLTTETSSIVKLSNGIRNLPTTKDARESKDLVVDDNYKVFLDIHSNPNTSTTPPSAVGAAYQDEFSSFLQQYQSGEQTDLAGGIKKVDDQINNLIKLAG